MMWKKEGGYVDTARVRRGHVEAGDAKMKNAKARSVDARRHFLCGSALWRQDTGGKVFGDSAFGAEYVEAVGVVADEFV